MSKTKVQVYDWPVRFFHWVFALLFVAAFFIAKTFDDDSAQYPYHMMIGFTLAFAVILRILWGIFGTKFARFHSFELSPVKLLNYFKDLLKAPGETFLGHNPASSWAAVIMIICALGLAGTGYFMVHGQKEALEDIHELFANLFLFTAIAHVAGVILHTVRYKEAIGLSMINGQKSSSDPKAGIDKNFIIIGLIFLILVGGFSLNIIKNYDSSTRSLKLFGITHQLGELEKDE